jgi:uncharacterized protein
MKIWALADLHLSLSCPEKNMEVFGSQWTNYQNRIKENWKAKVSEEDLILLAGDITWALKFEQALEDLNWIHKLPGTKVMLKGNHDYWWASSEKMKQNLPSSIHFVYNSCFDFGEVSIGGSRLWDSSEYNYNVPRIPSPKKTNEDEEKRKKKLEEAERIFPKELNRLRLSLEQLNPKAKIRIAMTHYPPIGPDLSPSKASSILEELNVDICVFGHIHGLQPGSMPLGKARGVLYHLTACDYLNCDPIEIL